MHLLGNPLICASTVLEWSCCRIHRYVAAPKFNVLIECPNWMWKRIFMGHISTFWELWNQTHTKPHTKMKNVFNKCVSEFSFHPSSVVTLHFLKIVVPLISILPKLPDPNQKGQISNSLTSKERSFTPMSDWRSFSFYIIREGVAWVLSGGYKEMSSIFADQ